MRTTIIFPMVSSHRNLLFPTSYYERLQMSTSYPHHRLYFGSIVYYPVDMGESHSRVIIARDIMLEFAEKTGFARAGSSPERYLWTDAFGVCNFLGLYRRTCDEKYRRLALLLVEQVHAILGRHRPDDARTGWISGLEEEEGKRHPTKGGLRIGKRLRERRPDEPFDERLEWDRDGQYFHYLTQWMHVLGCVSVATGDVTFTRWAMELAKTAHEKFLWLPVRAEVKRLYWKMSIDLSYPLVSSMGHHDPLDGLITYWELQAISRKMPGLSPLDLGEETAEMTEICSGKDWATDDTLGIGVLLTGAWRMGQLCVNGGFTRLDLFGAVLEDCLRSLQYFENGMPLNLPVDYRLAFREFGLSIGLQAIERLQGLVAQHPEVFRKLTGRLKMERFSRYVPIRGAINAFWIEDRNRESAAWAEHRNINMVMLATSLLPEGYLSV